MARKPQACLSCLENGREHYAPECRAYAEQVSWNRRMRRLLAAEPERNEVPAAPDYSNLEAVGERAREAGTGNNDDILQALRGNGRVYRQYRLALERAGLPAEVLEVTPAPRRRSRRAA